MHLINSHGHDSREIKVDDDDDDNFVIIMRCYFLLHLLCKNSKLNIFIVTIRKFIEQLMKKKNWH